MAEYTFKHPLTQEVALGSQLGERRRAAHAAVARAIEKQDAHRLDEQAAVLAHHFDEAGEALETLGDSKLHVAELVEAHRLYEELGATGHAERLARVLASPSPNPDGESAP